MKTEIHQKRDDDNQVYFTYGGIVLAQRYHKGCYHERNAYLVDHAACLVAWYDGSMGGTQQTFLLALHRGLRVENLGTIAPDPRLF